MLTNQKTVPFFLFLFLSIFSFGALTAQVQIGSTNYSTLQDAFDAVSNGTVTGNIDISRLPITYNLHLLQYCGLLALIILVTHQSLFFLLETFQSKEIVLMH